MNLDLLHAMHWARPQLLWALLALPLILLWNWRRRRDRRRWQRVVDAHLLPHLLVAGSGGARSVPWALLLGWTLAVLALAGPGWRQQAQPLLQPQSPLVLVLDLSTRITTTDLPPSRLLQARAKLASLLRQREGGQVALVVYADDAYTVAPLTDDVANVALYLDALSPQVMPADGQRAERALDWATRLLQRSGMRGGRILLLTDRADAAAVEAAGQARSQGMQVSVLGLGTPAGAAYRDGRGQIASAALEEASLRRLASAGGGRYQRLASDGGDLQALDLLRADPEAGSQARGEVRQWLDQGYWLLLPVMLLALLAFRRRAAVLSMLLLVGAGAMQPLPADAAPASPSHADAGRGSAWLRADQLRQRQLERGVQAYHAGDFAGAARAFEQVDSAEGWYNLGNARARQGDLDGAVQAYDRALQRQAGMPDAVANRAVVDAARKRKPPPGPKQDGSPASQGDGGSPSAGQGQPQPPSPSPPPPSQADDAASSREPPQATSPAGAPPPGDGQPPQAQPPPDPQAQARADAEQRERMQQAIQQGEGQPAQDSEAQRADGRTPRQREQQQAVEAWMRRVPDEPGDLLRTKFQLENERRKREGR